MKKTLMFVCAALVVGSVWAKGGGGGHGSSGSHGSSSSYGSSASGHSVSGYVRSNGTYVAPSHATNPNATRSDNWTTKGNVNPYTGKEGTRQ